jgi:hypothetical protein
MSTPDVKNAASVAQTIVSAQDVNLDGSMDRISVEQRSAGEVKTGIYNINTPEGRAAAKAALLDLGLTMPEFLSSTGEKYIQNLPSDLRGGLDDIAMQASASAETAATTQGTGSNTGGVSTNLQGRWAEFMGKISTTGNVDVNTLVQFVLREAYMENTKDLHFYAQKVKFYNDLKKGIRDELTQARELLSFQAGKDGKDAVVYSNENGSFDGDVDSAGKYHKQDFVTEPAFDEATGQWVVQPSKDGGTVTTKEDLETYIKNLEEKLSSVGDDAQLANVDLQNMLQKQQQTLQMMSNISKMLHDTAMAVIRKMGG